MLMYWVFVLVPKGSKITFSTETFGLAFYVGQRKVRSLEIKFFFFVFLSLTIHLFYNLLNI